VRDASAAGRVYLDYASFAPVDPRVLAVMRPFLEAGIGNPSASHALGAEARDSLEAARAKVARLCGGAASGVVFTSGATEANNLAVKGTVKTAGRGGRIVLAPTQHASLINACREFEGAGTSLVFVPVDRDGRVDSQAVRGAITGDTLLVSVGAASDEIGTLQPLAEIGRLARAAGVPFHVDGVGAVGRVPLDVDGLGIDLLSISGNDIYGPPGTGALWVRPGSTLHPQMVGEGQERGYRSGTENLPGVVGLGVAAELMRTEAQHGENARVALLRDRLMDGLVEAVPECRVTGARTARLPHHASVLLRGIHADALVLDLDEAEIAASTGPACAARNGAASPVLRAIGCAPDEVRGSLCFTLGRWSGAADVAAVLERLPPIVARQRALAAFAPR